MLLSTHRQAVCRIETRLAEPTKYPHHQHRNNDPSAKRRTEQRWNALSATVVNIHPHPTCHYARKRQAIYRIDTRLVESIECLHH